MTYRFSIDISPDDVVIEGQKVFRPTYIPRSDWLEAWNRAEMTLLGVRPRERLHSFTGVAP
jgi:hypothetical protein